MSQVDRHLKQYNSAGSCIASPFGPKQYKYTLPSQSQKIIDDIETPSLSLSMPKRLFQRPKPGSIENKENISGQQPTVSVLNSRFPSKTSISQIKQAPNPNPRDSILRQYN